MSRQLEVYAKVLWNFLQIKDEPKTMDCLIILGSNDPRVAEYAAQLMLKGYAPIAIFTGAQGRNTEGLYQSSEAEHFAEIARNLGVEESKIIVEPCATNTGENIEFSLSILKKKGIVCNSYLLVQKNYMGRRALATFRVHEKHKEVCICCPNIDFENYPDNGIDRDLFINAMVGNFQRVLEYPKSGYQIEQSIPPFTMEAYRQLISSGYDKQLILNVN